MKIGDYVYCKQKDGLTEIKGKVVGVGSKYGHILLKVYHYENNSHKTLHSGQNINKNTIVDFNGNPINLDGKEDKWFINEDQIEPLDKKYFYLLKNRIQHGNK